MELLIIGLGLLGGIGLGIINLLTPNINSIFYYAPLLYILNTINPLLGLSIVIANIGVNLVWNFITWETPDQLTHDPLLQNILLTNNNNNHNNIKELLKNKVNGYVTAIIFSYILFNTNLLIILKLNFLLLPIGFLIFLLFIWILYTESKNKTITMVALIGSIGIAGVVVISGYKDSNLIMTLVTALFSIGGTLELLTNPKGYYKSLNVKSSLELKTKNELKTNGQLKRNRSSRGKNRNINTNINTTNLKKKGIGGGEGLIGLITGVISSIFIGTTCSSIYAYITNKVNNNKENNKVSNKEILEKYMYAKGISEGLGFILMIFGLGQRDATANFVAPLLNSLSNTPIILLILLLLFSILFSITSYNFFKHLYLSLNNINNSNSKEKGINKKRIWKGLGVQIVVMFLPYIISGNFITLLIPISLLIWAFIFNRLISNSGLSRTFSTSVLSFIPIIGIMGV